MASSGSNQPNPSLCLSNLATKVKNEDLRRSLYSLFAAHGKVIDVVVCKGSYRGQAFVVFRDIQSATAARRREDGNVIFGKPLKISYSRSKSHATVLQESGPEALYALKLGIADEKSSKVTLSRAERENREAKRAREGLTDKRDREEEEEEDEEDEDEDGKRAEKVRKVETDAAEEEMAMESDEDEGPQPLANGTAKAANPSSNILSVSNLPAAVEPDMLTVLFQQFAGFLRVKMLPASPETHLRSAEINYESPKDAGVAKESLDGFQIDKGVHISVGYAA